MTANIFAADVDVAARYVEAGALQLRLVAGRLGKGEPGLEAAAPQLLAFIADGMLERSEILRCAAERAAASPEGGA
jgi:hypothetical protein